MVALVAALALAGPPKATLVSGPTRARLAVSSWCWGARCGAPIAASTKPLIVARGSLVTIELGFVPRHARIAVGGIQATVETNGRTVSWRARRGGGLTVHVTGPRGWVTYVGRIRLG